jgi:hypothetical protein
MKPRDAIHAVLVLVCAVSCVRVRAQDSGQILQQLNTLQQQMAGATDPCPFMPKLKSLINQMAQQSPDIYAAMKPSLDLLNSTDDGCSTSSSAESTPPQSGPSQGSGTVAPPSCVYLGPGNCVPIAQYQQTQKNSAGSGICPASGFVPGISLPAANKVMSPVPCKPGTRYGPLIATTYNGGYTGVTPPDNGTTSLCPASGYVMVQTGDVAVSKPCRPGSPISTGSTGGGGGSKSFSYDLLTAGDCVLERGRLTLNPDGSGQWTAYIHTNHTTNRDIWHVSFNVVDSSGRQLFPQFLGDSPGMYGSPSPTIPWVVNFQFNASQFRLIDHVTIQTSC